VDLTCELSPLVFSELYRLLAADQGNVDALAERLHQIDLDRDWMTGAADSYDAKWQHERGRDAGFTLSSAHALLASWILASLRHTGSSIDLSTVLATRVRSRYFDEVPDATTVPPSLQSGVVAWTLGKIVGDIDQRLPLVPAHWPDDTELSAAYRGLVEHTVHLGEILGPWPEMVGTSTIWRGAGIAEALRPSAAGPEQAINTLMAEARSVLQEYEWEQLRRHWIGFIEARNALTHVAPVTGKLKFTDSRDRARNWEDVRLTVFGITQFVCLEVSGELTSSASRCVRPDSWEELTWELGLY